MVADFWDAIEEAERARSLALMGVHELAKTLERQEKELGVSREDADLPDDVFRTLQALWERAESASIEITNGFSHFNAQALLSMNSALDSLVEELVPATRDAWVRTIVNEAFRDADEKSPDAAGAMTPELRERLMDVFRSQALDQFPELVALSGKGIQRYERRLAQIGLAAPPDRPIPADLDQALAELGALRDVLEHRAGRVDSRALRAAPSLPYHDGQLVRIRREQYRHIPPRGRAFGRRSVCAACPWKFNRIQMCDVATASRDGDSGPLAHPRAVPGRHPHLRPPVQ